MKNKETWFNMLESLDQLDKKLFLFLNGLHNGFTDAFMGFATEKESWFPFYGIILIYIFWVYRWRGFIVLVGIALTIVLADQFSSAFCKPFFERLRPCHSPEIGHLVHMVRGCGGQFGFISGHASNSFGLAMFLFLLFRERLSYVWLIFVWAAVVAYSRIAVGVHYPGDILAGAVAGVFWGWLAFKVYQYADAKIPFPQK